MKQFIKDTWYVVNVDTRKWFNENKATIWYHTRSILDSFFTGVSLDLLAHWGELTGADFERSIWLGIIISAVRTGMKMARVTTFVIAKAFLEKEVKK